MDMGRSAAQKAAVAAINTAAILFHPIKRPLTVSPHPSQRPEKPDSKPKPKEARQSDCEAASPASAAFDDRIRDTKRLYSILSASSFDSFQCRDLLKDLTPDRFDSVFWEIHKYVDPTTALKFFYSSCNYCGFRFTLRSHCLLFHLLVYKNLDSAARLLLIRLIDGKLPLTLRGDVVDLHREIATVLADACLGSEKLRESIRGFDILVHVYATEFKRLGFDVAMDVFMLLASKELVLSFKTCNFLMTLLVKADKLEKCYEVFTIVSKNSLPDVYLYSTAITALCEGGKVEEAIELFKQMESKDVAPNAVIYNNLMHGLCRNGRLEEAFQLKEKMVDKGVKPTIVTYSLLINGLTKLEKYREADCVLKEMSGKGIIPNVVVYNTLIGGYCKMEIWQSPSS